jgi:hypothetical protein
MESMFVQVKTSIKNYGKEEVKYKIDIMKQCVHSMTGPFTFEQPSRITLPSKGSISTIQENVRHTRMGYGRTSKPKNSIEKERTSCLGQKRPIIAPLPHKLVSTCKRKGLFILEFPRLFAMHALLEA